MNRKLLNISLIALMCCILIPIASVGGQGIPNSDTITIVTFGSPETIDPHWAYDTASGELIQDLYEPLCMFDGPSAEAYIPAIADWWPGLGVNPGNAITPIKPGFDGYEETWLFRIRANVPWHDSKYGYVTAADVEYSFERGMYFDHTAGPMWMLYEPLLAGGSSYDFDEDGDGTLNEAEYLKLDEAVDKAIQSNATHVWFNLVGPYAPFQQILCQTWSEVMCKQWSIDHGLWKGNHKDYADFKRTWDPPEPGPLMEQPDAPGPVKPGPVAMGTGPYKLAAMNPDPHTGWYTFEKFDAYWRGWPAPGGMFTDKVAAGGSAKFVTVKNVEEWANRKAQFFSTDPALQADIAVVPRPNIPEMHAGGDINGPTLPGFRLWKIDSPILGAMYFTFAVNPTSDHVPKVGPTPKPEMFKDRYLRLAFAHMINFTKYIKDVYLGDAKQSPVCMPAGTAFFNETKPKYDINIAKATEYFQKALGGEIWSKGLTLATTYNIGNIPRQVACEMLEYNIENLIPWPAGVPVDIKPTGIPWSIYLPGMRNQMYPLFFVGWLADFPDPHNWFVPFMHPVYGTYCRRQKVQYGLDLPGSITIAENWDPGATYGPPPYKNALGETVTAINDTYVAHLIDTAVGEEPEMRHLLYEELMDIYYADITQLPLVYTVTRQYERTWLRGTDKTFNLNPINPGVGTSGFWYVMWKAPVGTIFEADISAVETITNTTTAYPLIQVYHGEMRLNGKPATIDYTVHVVYKTGTADVWVLISLLRNSTDGRWFFPISYSISLSPGEDYTATFTWYEDGVSTTEGGKGIMEQGTWKVSLYVSPSGVPGGEVVDPNLANNKADHPQLVTAKEFPADLNGDGIVSIKDIFSVAAAFGAKEGEARYDVLADINLDGVVNIKDIYVVASKFGRTLFTI